MKSYFLRRGDKMIQLTLERLEAAAKRGQLRADDLVSDGPNGPWTPASSVPELSVLLTPTSTPSNPFPASMTRHKTCSCANCQPVQQAGELDTGKLIEGVLGILVGIASLAMAAWWAALAFSL